MSLKFGLYLVEQGIITCDQFCGLVKIQQESKTSLGTIAIQKNIMTIKQVATVLEQLEISGNKSFIEIALQNDFIEQADANQLLQADQMNRPKIRQIIVNVGLMTDRQVGMLYQHFERVESRLHKAQPNVQTPQLPRPQEQRPAQQPATNAPTVRPPQPKFKQRPVIVQQNYSGQY